MGWFTGSSPKVVASPRWSPEQQGLSNQFSGYLSKNLGRDTTYPGINDITKLQPIETQSMGLMEQLLSGSDPYGSEGLLKQIISGRPVTNMLNPERARNYMSATVKGPIMERLMEETLPSINASAGKGGTYFSTMRGVEQNKAREQAGEEIGKAEETFSYQQLLQQIALEEAERSRQQDAMKMGLQYPLTQAATGMEIGAAARLPKMYGLSAYESGQGRNNQLMQLINQYLNTEAYNYTVTPGQKGGLSSIIGLLGALAL
jgi:hypothetical protein